MARTPQGHAASTGFHLNSPRYKVDQDPEATKQAQRGKRHLDPLAKRGFNVQVASWAKPTGEGSWFRYRTSRVIDDRGPAEAYGLVLGILRQMSERWIDPFEIGIVGLDDSLARIALSLVRPMVAVIPFSVRPPMPYPGMSRFSGATLGGVSIDGAHTRHPSQSGVSV